MGRLLKHREKDNRWRLWSTGTDSWLTEWLTEARMKQYIALEHELDYKARIVELYMVFPWGYTEKDTDRWLRNDDGLDAFHEWQKQAFKGNYYEAVDKKFKELTEEAA